MPAGGVIATCARRGMASSGCGSQRQALADRFADALSLPKCPLLQFGMDDVFLQLGPVVVQHDIVMLLAVVTDRYGCRRALDSLAAEEVPHLTIGKLAEGGGWVYSAESRNVVWNVCHAPRPVPDCPTLAWSRSVLFQAMLSKLVEEISCAPFLKEASRGPLAVRLVFDWEASRFLLVGGEALRVYRQVQDMVSEYFVSRDAAYAFHRWALSDDIDSFGAHITCGPPRSVQEPVSTPAFVPSQVQSSSWCACWIGLRRLLCRESGDKQLFLFVNKDQFAQLIGGGASSRAEADEFYDRWYFNVPENRRWGFDEVSSVSVAVDGVFLARAT